MKKTIGIMILLFLACQVPAAEEAWLTSVPEALAKAKKENKRVLLDFTGSDWCPPCKALHKHVLTTKEFSEFAKERLVLVELDFPFRKKQDKALKEANDRLQKEHDIKVFPTVIVLDKDGRVVFREAGYNGDAKAYITKLKRALAK